MHITVKQGLLGHIF